MRSFTKTIIVVMLVTISLSLGYWLGSEQGAETVGNAPGVTTSQEREILYYRNPMGLPDTSPVPKKDRMGMDYIPVYEGETQPSDHPAIKISTEKIQKLGVRTEGAVPRQLVRTVRAVATIKVDEQKLYTLVTKFEGWIHRLYVNTTGQTVKRDKH